MKDTRKPTIDPGYFDTEGAARHLGVSKSYFEDEIRPHVPVHDFRKPGGKKPMPRFARTDLDEWARTRRREKKAS